MSELLSPITLRNGLMITFEDRSNRYFGDFHRIFIRVSATLPDDFELPAGVARDDVKFERTLEKMGVPSALLAKEKQALVEAFLSSARAYLEEDDFPQRLAATAKAEKPKQPRFLFEKN